MSNTDWEQLQHHLHKGGKFGYYWKNPGKQSQWWGTEVPAPLPTNKANIYFGVHPVIEIPKFNASGKAAPPQNVRSQIGVIAAINCVFAEFDAKAWEGGKESILYHLNDLPLQPSIVIDSGGGYHCYWLLNKPLLLQCEADRTRAAHIQAAWVKFVQSDEDAKDLARVLRVPGTRNYKPSYKPDFPEVRVIHADYDQQYPLSSIEKLLPPPQRSQTVITPSVPKSDDACDFWLSKALERQGSRNERAVWLANQLRDNGVPRHEAEAVLQKFSAHVTNEKDHPYTEAEALRVVQWSYNHSPRSAAVSQSTRYGPPPPEDYWETNPPPFSGQEDNPMDMIPPFVDEPPPEHTAYNAVEFPTLISQLETLGENTPIETIEALARNAIPSCTRLGKTEILEISDKLKSLGIKGIWITEWKRAIADERKRQQAAKGAQYAREAGDTFPYEINNGQIVYIRQQPLPDGGSTYVKTPVADFTAEITAEIVSEGGNRSYIVEGKGIRGGPFQTEIRAESFADEKQLRAALSASVGAKDPIRARMSSHLAPAIQLFTKTTLPRITRYDRTGWAAGRFLLPMRDIGDDSIEVSLGNRNLPYAANPNADEGQGLVALDALLHAKTLGVTTVAIAALLQAPIARLANLLNERYCLFIRGRTNSFKTSWATVAMCLYGSDFVDESRLMKWGEGATRNSVMNVATKIHDLPLLIDNFKPNIGEGSKAFVALIHNIIEGSEKMRLNRDSELRDSKPIFCFPIVTGEDVPDTDSASLTRALVVTFAPDNAINPKLTEAQELAWHLPAIGESWLSWLESDEGQAAAHALEREFPARRDEWIKWLSQKNRHFVSGRVASALAGNVLTWQLACKHPLLGSLLSRYNGAYKEGIREVAQYMAEATGESLEANRLIEALHSLLSTKQAVFKSVGHAPLDREADRVIGWKDEEDGTVYLDLSQAKRAALSLIGRDGLSGMSDTTLRNQIKDLGYIQTADKGRLEKTKRVYAGHKDKFLHLKADVLPYLSVEEEIASKIAQQQKKRDESDNPTDPVPQYDW